jgi:hypothetical protein
VARDRALRLGPRDAMKRKRECVYGAELDLRH